MKRCARMFPLFLMCLSCLGCDTPCDRFSTLGVICAAGPTSDGPGIIDTPATIASLNHLELEGGEPFTFDDGRSVRALSCPRGDCTLLTASEELGPSFDGSAPSVGRGGSHVYLDSIEVSAGCYSRGYVDRAGEVRLDAGACGSVCEWRVGMPDDRKLFSATATITAKTYFADWLIPQGTGTPGTPLHAVFTLLKHGVYVKTHLVRVCKHSCSDSVQNWDEEGVDCGGSCDPCQ